MKTKFSILRTVVSFVLLLTMIFQIVNVSLAAEIKITNHKDITVVGERSPVDFWHDSRKLNNGYKQSPIKEGYGMFIRYATTDTKKTNPTTTSVYCVQPGQSISNENMTLDTAMNYLRDSGRVVNKLTTPSEKETLLKYVMAYGEIESWASANDRLSGTELKKWFARYIATQFLCWEVIVEDRDANFELNTTQHSNSYVNSVFDDFSGEGKQFAKDAYNEIVEKIKHGMKELRLSASTIKLEWDGEVYKQVITDYNNCLDNFYFTSNYTNLKIQTSGNKLTIWAYELPNYAIEITPHRNLQIHDILFYQGRGTDNKTQEFMSVSSEIIKKEYNPIPGEIHKYGKIEIQKVSAEPTITNNNPNYSLEGAEFKITGGPKNVNITIKTDKNGYAETSSDLEFGTYKIQETKAPKGFLLNNTVYTVYINNATPVVNKIYVASTSVKETPKYGMIKVTKLDKETGTVEQGAASLKGAVFAVYNSKGELVDTIKCNGTTFGTTTQALPFGEYTIKETVAPKGYKLTTETYKVTVSEASTNPTVVEVEIKNPVIKANVEITKYKTYLKEDGTKSDKEPFAGVKFTLKSKTTGAIFNPVEVVTGEDGKIRFEDLPYDTYEVIEETPAGYKKAEIDDIVVDTDGKTYKFDVVNEMENAKLIIEKHSKDDLNIADIIFNITGKTIDGSDYEITATTDENGRIVITLPYGEYTVSEEECSANRYYFIPEEQTFVLKGNKTIKFYNEEVTGDISIEKRVQNNDLEYEKGEGIVFNLTGTSYAGYEVDLFATTDENGLASFNGVPVGTYTLKEVANDANEKYLLQDPLTVVLATNNTIRITVDNDLITSTVKLIKHQKGSEDVLVKGAEYTLFDENGDVFATGITDENGIVEFENVPFGDYILKETKSPFGYYLNDTEYPISIVNHAEIITIEAEDEVILTDITISKQSKETGEYLADTEFTLYDAETNEVIAVAVTDETGFATFHDIPYGNYIIRETNPPEGYVNDSLPVSFELNDDYEEGIVHEFEDSEIPQTGSDISNSVLLLILTFMLFCLTVSSGRLVDIIKRKRTI